MRRPPLVVLFLLLFTGMLLLIFWQLLREPSAAPQNTNVTLPQRRSAPEVTVADPTRGNTANVSAPTIVVFGDYECAVCKQQEEELIQVLESRGDIRVVWKNAPFVQQHPQAQAAAEAALCAGRQGQYFNYHDALFAQTSLADAQVFSAVAIGLGLDESAFQICTETHATAPLVRRTTEEAVALELTGVPTIFIAERRFDGLITAAQMLTALPAP